jgi:SAM-dependent methyltransferase
VDEAAQQRIDGIRAVWSAGSYEAVGDLWASIGDDLAAELDDRVGLAGSLVLDAACGTGNTTLALARRGAVVTGMDLTPDLLATAVQRADSAGLDVAWQEGDLLAMPFDDDSFDVVTSTFGAFTADDPHRCAAELVRVCRPGGTIALTAWRRDGIFDRGREPLFARYPILDQNRPDTGAWAERDGLEDRFAGTGARLVDLEERDIALPFPSVEAAVDFFGRMSGPMVIARMAVEGMGGDWDALIPEIVAAWQAVAEPTEDGVVLRSPYARALLEVPA